MTVSASDRKQTFSPDLRRGGHGVRYRPGAAVRIPSRALDQRRRHQRLL